MGVIPFLPWCPCAWPRVCLCCSCFLYTEAYGLPAYVGHACVAGADAQQYGEGALTPCPAGMLPIQDPVPVAELASVAFLACALVMLSPLMP
jgi:hypothetical protein